MQHASNLLYTVDDEHSEPHTLELLPAAPLQRAQLPARSFQLYETHFAAGEKHDAVGHAVPAGGYKFRAEAARFPNGLHQSLFNRALEHTCDPPLVASPFCSRCVLSPVLGNIPYLQAFLGFR